MSQRTWKEKLGGQLPAELGDEIDVFATQIALRKSGKLEPKLFAETRLRRGAYGQRYDNGKRHDGERARDIAYPCGGLEKGPETVWDAPGMMRIKLPMGRVSPDQMDMLAEVAEEYSDSILHVTTRQDIQLHFVHIEDSPDMMRRLGSVGITTREACGNAVRNVTACEYAGVCNDQGFDVTPYAHAITYHLLGHKDAQDFGRKMKIAFSGCAEHPCGLANFHDIGCVAATREEGGEIRRGFKVYVGGGLGSVPHMAKLLDEFVPEEELLPMCQAVCRVFARLGERKNRARARLKFVVKKLGIDEFRKVVFEERAKIPTEDQWTAYLKDLSITEEVPLREGAPLGTIDVSREFATWKASNARPQAQEGYTTATITLPLGDLTSEQLRGLADMARVFTGDTVRLTVEQNIMFRWLPERDLPEFYAQLERLKLGIAGAGGISDIVACPGTDTCKLGISASRGLAAALDRHFSQQELHPDVQKLHLKASGCFNSCAQHHVADIGLLGVSRNQAGRRVSHFQLVVGGEWANNGGSYGLAIGAFPSKRIPQVVDRLTQHWIEAREPGEKLQDFIQRTGRAKLKKVLEDLRPVPDYADDKSFYTDWGDAREYTIGDIGTGECAGEVVTLVEFGLADSERSVFDAQVELESGHVAQAAALAYRSMLIAAQALVRIQNIDVSDEADDIVSEFRTRYCDTNVFADKYAGSKFATYLLETHANPPNGVSPEQAHRHIEEAQLFIEAAHRCHDKLYAETIAAEK